MHERKDRKVPNFFIVGAPKCGTTALNEYLRDHPNIFISTPKEPHYFAEDFRHHCAQSLESYLKLFEEATEEHIAVGEASVFYLFYYSAISDIFSFNKEAKIVVMLRNPVDLVCSLHSQNLYTRDEDVSDFEIAWRLQPQRKKGLEIPKSCRFPVLLQYADIGKLGSQVERVFNIFAREQVKLIVFDDFAASTKAVYEDVLSFLGVPYDGRTYFPRINKNRRHLLMGLAIFHRRPWRRYTDKLKDLLGIQRFGFTDALRSLNKREAPRKPLSPELRAELENEFREDIEKLSNLIGRDLSHWIAGKSALIEE